MIPWSFPSGNKAWGLKEGEERAVMNPQGRAFSVVDLGAGKRTWLAHVLYED